MTVRLLAVVLFAALAAGIAGAVGPWRTGTRMPQARSEVGSAVVGREIVVVGGFLANGDSSPRVDAYAPARNRWRRLPDLPVGVNHAMAAAAGGSLYVVGGYGAEQSAFVLAGGRWRRLPDLPAPRAAAGAAVVGGKLYVVGGVAQGRLATEMLVLDLRSARWSTLPGPISREHLGVTALGGAIYVVGGRKAGTNYDFFQSYLPGRNRWVRLPAVPQRRGGTAAAAVGRFIVSAGGEAASGTLRAVYAFDVRAKRWRRLPDLPTPRHGLALRGFAGRVYAIAGGPKPGLYVSSANEFLRLR